MVVVNYVKYMSKAYENTKHTNKNYIILGLITEVIDPTNQANLALKS